MVEIYKMNIWLISLVAISGIVFEVSEGQEVVIVMQPKVDFLVGTSANITCSYSVSDVAYVFDYIAWSHTTKDGEHDPANNVAAYLAGLPAPSYPGGGTRYTMSIDTIETSSVLMISSVAFPSDQGRYWCFAQFKKPGLTPIDDAKASLLTVVVETKTDSVTLYSAAGVPLINGTEVELSTDVPEHLFTFKVKGINPGANFTWTVGSMVLDTVSDPDHVVGPDSLTTSTSNATVRSDKDYDKLELKCVAVNYVDDPGVMISVILRVEAPTPAATTTKSTSSDDPGSGTTKDVSTTGSSTTMVSTSTGPGASSTLTSTPTPILTTDDVDIRGSTGGLTTGQIVGICVGAVSFVAILLVLTLCILCRESLLKQCSCLQCKSAVNPEKEGAITDKEALELNGGSTSNKEKEEG